MRLRNLLTKPGGVPLQGREVSFKLLYTSGKVPSVRDVSAVLLPLSVREFAEVDRETDAALAQPEKEGEQPRSILNRNTEYGIQMLRAALRDPGDLSARLCDDERDVQALRDGLIGAEIDRLAVTEYKALLAEEYPPVVTKPAADEMHREAATFSAGAQP